MHAHCELIDGAHRACFLCLCIVTPGLFWGFMCIWAMPVYPCVCVSGAGHTGPGTDGQAAGALSPSCRHRSPLSPGPPACPRSPPPASGSGPSLSWLVVSAAPALAVGPAAGAREAARNKAGREPVWGSGAQTRQGWGSSPWTGGQAWGAVVRAAP